jgi:hypothetical protein
VAAAEEVLRHHHVKAAGYLSIPFGNEDLRIRMASAQRVDHRAAVRAGDLVGRSPRRQLEIGHARSQREQRTLIGRLGGSYRQLQTSNSKLQKLQNLELRKRRNSCPVRAALTFRPF